MKTIHTCISIVVLVVASLVVGCASSKPFDYHSGNEIPKGPGLFSKDEGEFTIYSSKKKQAEAAQKPPEQAAGEVSATSSENAPVEKTEEFQQFKKWQEEQKEYEAFQQWKQSPQNAKEYEEFQQWQRWKAYQEWQKAQQKAQ